MIIGSTKEDLSLEKRVSLTPDTAKSIIGLGLKIYIEKNYAIHIGIQDEEFKKVGLDTAKSILELEKEDLIKRTDLEEETVIEVIRILKAEFEE